MIQTGSGWFTIKIGRVVANGKKGGGSCDHVSSIGHKNARACDVYIKLIVNGEDVLPKEVKNDAKEFNANLFYTSKKIPKTATIKIEVRDDDGGNDDEILTASKYCVKFEIFVDINCIALLNVLFFCRRKC